MKQEWRTKVVTIEAVQYDGKNIDEIRLFTGKENLVEVSQDIYSIVTLEGKMLMSVGDYIIKGLKGEFYPCKPDIFHMKYERNLVWDENI